MANDNGVKNGNGKLSKRHALLAVVVSSILGSTGGPYLLVKFGGINPYRSDPFTGADARVMDARITRLETHVRNHPDQTHRFDSRLTALETRQSLILSNQERILDKLNR